MLRRIKLAFRRALPLGLVAAVLCGWLVCLRIFGDSADWVKHVSIGAGLAVAGYCFVFALQVSMLLTLHVPRVQYMVGQLDRRE